MKNSLRCVSCISRDLKKPRLAVTIYRGDSLCAADLKIRVERNKRREMKI